MTTLQRRVAALGVVFDYLGQSGLGEAWGRVFTILQFNDNRHWILILRVSREFIGAKLLKKGGLEDWEWDLLIE